MCKGILSLILLGFIGFSTPLFAQNRSISGTIGTPQKSESKENYQISVEQWEANERIKNNFNKFNTIPFYNKSDIQFDLGPAQFQIRVLF